MIKSVKVLSRLASLGLALVLLMLGGFSLWSAIITQQEAKDASNSVHISDLYDQTRYEVSVEESQVELYRIWPIPATKATFQIATTLLTKALLTASQSGGKEELMEGRQQFALHHRYLQAVNEMFSAIDANDTGRIEQANAKSDSLFIQFKQSVNAATNLHRQEAIDSLNRLSSVHETMLIATPIVFGVGLLLVLAFWMVLRVYQRRMDEVTQTELTRFERAALIDNLTNLGNHRAYQNALQRAIERVQQDKVQAVLALINIDELKGANDKYGHLYGDHILVELANTLAIFGSESAFRLSGDEFAVVLPQVSLSQARESCEHLRQDVESRSLGSTISIGLAITTAQEQDIDLLQQQADAALHEAKSQGRNTIVTFEEIRATTSMLTPLKVQAFRRLLEEQRVTVAFQPIWDMQEGRVMAFEALSRPAPDYGFSGPQEAFDIAEKLGHAHELDFICVQAILRRARELPPGVLLFLNLTPQSLVHDLLTGAVLLKGVIEAGLTVDRVVVEVTERSTLPIAVVVQQARKLRELGFRLALDDAGAGNAGLEIMSQLAVDFIKIDRAVVVNALTDKAAQGVLAGIAAIAREMEAFVVVEGIENTAMLELVQRNGLQAAQGYLLGRPSEVIPDLKTLQVYSPLAQIG